jgi:hypothetical protein
MIISRGMKHERRRRKPLEEEYRMGRPNAGHPSGLLPVRGPNTAAISTDDASNVRIWLSFSVRSRIVKVRWQA